MADEQSTDETTDELTDETSAETVAATEDTVAEEATANDSVAEEATANDSVAEEATANDTAAGTAGRQARKVRDGVVVSNKMDKTAVVAVVERVRHAKYAKFVNRTKRLYVHDDANDVNVGDRVRVMETRPTSKLKRWRVVEVLERAK